MKSMEKMNLINLTNLTNLMNLMNLMNLTNYEIQLSDSLDTVNFKSPDFVIGIYCSRR